MKFLIDECLALSLADLAIEAGFVESAHVVRRGMSGLKDPELMRRIVDEDWTLVTRNADDFRPTSGSSSARPCYVGVPLHPGLVCLNMPEHAGEPEHRGYFDAALSQVGNPGDLTNEVMEVWPEGEALRVHRYFFPEND